jgi:transglutaminase-like putative cysteine protease
VVDAHIFFDLQRRDRKLPLRRMEISLISLKIHHETIYRFNEPVALGPHRLMLRPRESRDLRLISSQITITPEAAVTWANDVFGNAVATAIFRTTADSLVIDGVMELQLDAVAWPVFSIVASATVFPFRYSEVAGASRASANERREAGSEGRGASRFQA